MANQINKNVFTWSIIVALGGFLFGFDTAVISGVEQHIQQLFQLSSFLHGFTISSALIGTVTGALISGRPADRFGRKPILFVIAALYVITAIGSALAGNVTILYHIPFSWRNRRWSLFGGCSYVYCRNLACKDQGKNDCNVSVQCHIRDSDSICFQLPAARSRS